MTKRINWKKRRKGLRNEREKAIHTYRQEWRAQQRRALELIRDSEPNYQKGGFELVNKQIDFKPDEPLLTIGRFYGTDPNT